MLRIALRAHRTGFLVTALLSSVTMFVEAAGFAAAAGQTPAQRAVFGQQMEALAGWLGEHANRQVVGYIARQHCAR